MTQLYFAIRWAWRDVHYAQKNIVGYSALWIIIEPLALDGAHQRVVSKAVAALFTLLAALAAPPL